jgi:hypothetical protein
MTAAVTTLNAAVAVQFLRAYFAITSGQVFICSLSNEKGRGNEQHVITRDPAKVKKFLAQWDVAGRGTYYCTGTLKPGQERRITENIFELVGLHADIDFKGVADDPADILRQLMQLPCPPTIIVNSGHGQHCFWLFREPIGTDLGANVTARVVNARTKLAELLAGDAVHDLPRIMRLPGSRNTKNGDSIPVTVEHINRNRRYDLEELETWIAEQRPLFERTGAAPNVTINSNKTVLAPEHWLEIVLGGASDGKRNIQAARLAGHLLRNSWLDPRVVHALVQCWNIAAVNPPMTREEVTSIVSSIAGRERRRLENA